MLAGKAHEPGAPAAFALAGDLSPTPHAQAPRDLPPSASVRKQRGHPRIRRVDASVLVDLLLRLADAPALTDTLLDPTRALNAPQLVDIEVAETLRRYVRNGELPPARGRAALDDLADLPLERYPHSLLLPRIWDYRDNLTAYDTTYLAPANALACPVWTRDARCANAPPAIARVRLI